ncbi:BON domain-containing protein [Paraburkholderia acidipaludis]|uniref:BON domain-containing protein n=1 Tax=Paraburkholderia acidipaludis TaxID=660537 RepID=UPI00047F4BEB|nr:BON domain-containing protein [Paraburkholderia acidipaludis]
MKCFRIGPVLVSALIVAAPFQAHAQTSAPAESAASAPAGAKEAKAANRALQKSVIRTLARTRGLTVTNITVRANDGDVVLEGTVPEASQMDIAVQAARGVQGVKSVKSALTLSTF